VLKVPLNTKQTSKHAQSTITQDNSSVRCRLRIYGLKIGLLTMVIQLVCATFYQFLRGKWSRLSKKRKWTAESW